MGCLEMSAPDQSDPDQAAMSSDAVIASVCGHPNEIDLRRVARALDGRVRYRYVTPHVVLADRGYRITSPCCSRRIDPNGGEIDIALIEFIAGNGWWRLHHRDHAASRWVPYAEFARLHELLAHLNRDPGHVFWP